ncbi:MAG TPA: hypothetical protein DCZ12_10035 [Gammaproteobacteria bacterium]|nr:hypothetical protein [Gammaproteobacteria bacterium]
MSLVNDFLRDLEQSPGNDKPTALKDTKTSSPVPMHKTQRRLKPWLYLIALLAVCCALGFLLTKQPSMSDSIVIRTPLPLPESTFVRPVAFANKLLEEATPLSQVKSKKPRISNTHTTKKSVSKKAAVIRIRPSASPIEQRIQEASNLLRQQKNDTAIRLLTETLALAPEHLVARELLAETLLSNRQHEKANVILDEGLSHQPQHMAFLLLKVQALIGLKTPGKAIKILETNMALASNNIGYLSLLGSLYRQTDDHEKAVEIYKSALKIAPHSSAHWTGLAISLNALGEHTAAQRAYRFVLDIPSSSPELRRFAQEQIKLAGL